MEQTRSEPVSKVYRVKEEFVEQLEERGYNAITVDLSELLLGGGGIKCCTLELRGASA